MDIGTYRIIATALDKEDASISIIKRSIGSGALRIGGYGIASIALQGGIRGTAVH
jgi:hypothetical protein